MGRSLVKGGASWGVLRFILHLLPMIYFPPCGWIGRLGSELWECIQGKRVLTSRISDTGQLQVSGWKVSSGLPDLSFLKEFCRRKNMGLLGIEIPAVLESAWVQVPFCREGATVVNRSLDFGGRWFRLDSLLQCLQTMFTMSPSNFQFRPLVNFLLNSVNFWTYYIQFSSSMVIVWETGDTLASSNIYN